MSTDYAGHLFSAGRDPLMRANRGLGAGGARILRGRGGPSGTLASSRRAGRGAAG
jgi:hypothetical protein